MFPRILKPSKAQSFFLFGPRGSGKSTFLSVQWGEQAHFINLLLDQWYDRYSKNPDLLIDDIHALSPKPKWVVIDEIQKIPKLLDTVHSLVFEKKIKFVMTGSSARKLKVQSANLLAGRAFSYNMHPLTHKELQAKFNLDDILKWGSLPEIYQHSKADKTEFLRSYAQTYLKEEILQEQLVRNNQAFRQFLPIVAQENGHCINYSKIARDVDADPKTIQTFFQILEDTMVGFYLPAFHQSTRKSVKLQPKFYIFDLGIKNAMEGQLHNNLKEKTFAYGRAFEHFIICEMFRLNSYWRADFAMYHYQTTAGGEVDLVLKRGRDIIAIEIKSNNKIDLMEVRKLSRISEPLKPKFIYYVSQDPIKTRIGDVQCLHWRDFFTAIEGLTGSRLSNLG